MGQSASVYVEEARDWARALVTSEQRTAGEVEQAIRNVARRERLSRGTLWSLLYRPPKRIAAEIYFALGRAYELECERQMRRFEIEREKTAPKTRLGAALVRAADALAGETGEGLNGADENDSQSDRRRQSRAPR